METIFENTKEDLVIKFHQRGIQSDYDSYHMKYKGEIELQTIKTFLKYPSVRPVACKDCSTEWYWWLLLNLVHLSEETSFWCVF